MTHPPLTLRVHMDGAIFRRFALYDAFVRQGRRRSLALFSGILLAAALACALLRHQAEQALLLTWVLGLIAVGLPLVYYASYRLSIRQQIKAMGIAAPRYVYTVTIHPRDGITAHVGQEPTTYPWPSIHAAHRCPSATYVYVTPQRSYLLPHDQMDGGASALWHMLEEALPPSKRFPRPSSTK